MIARHAEIRDVYATLGLSSQIRVGYTFKIPELAVGLLHLL